MGGYVSCCKCGDVGGEYRNPLLTMHHIGKWNGRIICLCCIRRYFVDDGEFIQPYIRSYESGK